MRFLKLELIAFGHFTNTVLDFSEPEHAVHIVYGPNEAGKSTTLRAVTGLLYGIEERTKDAHLHEMKEMRVGARLVDSHGGALSVVRRKGRDKTLLNPEGGVLDEALLQKMLGSATKESFTKMFGLNHETLRAGADDLLSGKGQLGESLFGAGLGGGFHRVLEQLKKEADQIYTPQARKKPLNASILSFQEAKKRARDFSIASDDWLIQRKKLEETEAELKGCEEEIRALHARLNKLRRAQRLLPLFAKRRHLLEKKAALGDAPRVPEQAARDRELSLSDERDALDKIDQLSIKIASLEAQMAGLSIPIELIAEKEAVERVQPRLGMYSRMKGEELPRLRAEIEALHRRVMEALERLKPGLTLEECERLRLDAAVRTRIKKAAQKQVSAETEIRVLARKSSEIAALLAEANAGMSALPPPRDTLALQAIVKKIQKDGDVDGRHKKLGDERERLEEAARAKLAALPLWTGTLQALAELPLPAMDTIDRIAGECSELEQHQKRLSSDGNRARQAHAQVSRDLDELHRAGDVPTEDDLNEVRKKRDAAWEEWKRRALGHTKGKGAADNLIGLADEFEHQFKWADIISDRLRREAERVTKRAGMLASQHALQREINRIDKEYEEVRALLVQKREAWRLAWKPCGIEPLSPGEMRSFVHKHEALVREAEKLREIEQNQKSLRRDIEACAEELRHALADIGEQETMRAERSGELGPWLAHAERVINKIDQIEKQRAQYAEKIGELSRRERQTLEEQKAQQGSRTQCAALWTNELLPFGLSAEASGEDVAALIDALDGLYQDKSTLREKEAQAADKEREVLAFEEDIQRLVAEHAGDLVGAPVDHAAKEIVRRRQQAIDNAAEYKRIERDLSEQGAERRHQLHRIESARKRLAELLAAAGVSDLDALLAMEHRAREAQEIDRMLCDNDEQLLDAGEGADMDALERELVDIDRDRLAADLEEAQKQLPELETKQKDIYTRIGAINNEIGTLSGESKAAEAAAEAQEHLAQARGQLDKYLRAKLSVMVLEREIERFREENQGPILKCASELFARLTNGRFSRLTVSFDPEQNDSAVLECVRKESKNAKDAKEGRAVPMSGLSDGTRDQLFLSLRLASLLQYSKANEPMPLIVDDILVHFDDERAAAALSVLGEVCLQTQVLFFTHHARLLEIAKNAIAPERLREHRLSYSI